jgi:hypothetical protein
MFYKAKVAVYSEIRTKHINAMWAMRKVKKFEFLSTCFLYFVYSRIPSKRKVTQKSCLEDDMRGVCACV